jgi:AraC-like DNA-binding protein
VPEPLLASAHSGWEGIPFELHRASPTEHGIAIECVRGECQLRVVVEDDADAPSEPAGESQRLRVGSGSLYLRAGPRSGASHVPRASTVLVLDVSKQWLGRCQTPLEMPPDGSHVLAGTTHAPARLIARAMCEEVASGARSGTLFAEHLSLAILTYAFDRLPVSRLRVSGSLSQAQARKITRYIDKNLSQPLRSAELAALCGLGPRHFTSVFRLAFGTTPHAYVLERRLGLARQLLAGGGHDIAEVALRVGFSSQSHFSTAFRKACGMTPRAYGVLHRRSVH